MPIVVHETSRILAVCKPGGLLTQSPAGIDSMEVRVRRYLSQNQARPGKVYLGVPHRLDRPASGVMVFAKDKVAARFLAEQFQNRLVKKTYWALVAGTVEPDRGTWTDWMRKVPDEARSEICFASDSGAQSAVLHYRVVESFVRNDADKKPACLLEIDLETGRSHQIRLQSSSRGYPIDGDDLYQSQQPYGPQTEDMRLRWLALHARQLTVIDPDTESSLDLVADLPEHWPRQIND